MIVDTGQCRANPRAQCQPNGSRMIAHDFPGHQGVQHPAHVLVGFISFTRGAPPSRLCTSSGLYTPPPCTHRRALSQARQVRGLRLLDLGVPFRRAAGYPPLFFCFEDTVRRHNCKSSEGQPIIQKCTHICGSWVSGSAGGSSEVRQCDAIRKWYKGGITASNRPIPTLDGGGGGGARDTSAHPPCARGASLY